MLLAPGNRYVSQGVIEIFVPSVGNAILVNSIFKTAECASAAYGMAQIVTDVVILYRKTEAFHDAVFVDVKLGRQWEIVVSFENFTSDTDDVTLPLWKIL